MPDVFHLAFNADVVTAEKPQPSLPVQANKSGHSNYAPQQTQLNDTLLEYPFITIKKLPPGLVHRYGKQRHHNGMNLNLAGKFLYLQG